MLVVVVTLFATLWMPYRVLLVYNSFAKQTYMDLWFLMFCKTLIFINSAINPILYNAMSVKFRRAFKAMLSCTKQQHSPTTAYSTVGSTSATRQLQVGSVTPSLTPTNRPKSRIQNSGI